MALDLPTVVAEFQKLLVTLRNPASNTLQKALAVFDFVTTLRNQLPASSVATYGKLGDGKLLKLFLDNLPLLLSLLPLFLDQKP